MCSDIVCLSLNINVTFILKPPGKSSMCVAQAYVGAIDNLLKDLKNKFLSFVRCIKPNLSSTPQLFEDDIVEDQGKS